METSKKLETKDRPGVLPLHRRGGPARRFLEDSGPPGKPSLAGFVPEGGALSQLNSSAQALRKTDAVPEGNLGFPRFPGGADEARDGP